MKPVYQTDFSPGTGNALQACVASLLELGLEDVPNFVAAKEGYARSLDAFLARRGQAFLKVSLTDGALPFPCGYSADVPCVVAGGSPRGDHKHCVVGLARNGETGLALAFDPFEDRDVSVPMLTDKQWAGFIVSLLPHAAEQVR
eukprot:Rhum_TRINITY_DN13821_c1_g1::Rhum_TRINITY_DN13821_c1_g1_i1::g.64902::m.64902